MRARLAAAACLLSLLVACGEEAEPSGAASPQPSATPTATSSPRDDPTPSTAQPAGRPGTQVIAANSPFGRVLYDATGQAVYLFDIEQSRPRCYGACAVDWPPVLTKGEPTAAKGVRPALLGTVERRDGSSQVTYGGHPLYFYAHEGKRQVLCHDFVEYGGTWFALQPDGNRAP